MSADEAIRTFEREPLHPSLKNHALKGLRAIKAGYDLRILFKEEKGRVVVYFLDVGTHDAVY